MGWSMPGFLVLYHLLEFAQIYVHWVGDPIQPSNPLLPTSPPVLNLSQHQGLFQWVSSSHQMAQVLLPWVKKKIKPIKDTAQSWVTRDRAVAFVALLFWVHEGLPVPAPAPAEVGQVTCSSHWIWAEVTCVTSIKNQHDSSHPPPSQRCMWGMGRRKTPGKVSPDEKREMQIWLTKEVRLYTHRLYWVLKSLKKLMLFYNTGYQNDPGKDRKHK